MRQPDDPGAPERIKHYRKDLNVATLALGAAAILLILLALGV